MLEPELKAKDYKKKRSFLTTVDDDLPEDEQEGDDEGGDDNEECNSPGGNIIFNSPWLWFEDPDSVVTIQFTPRHMMSQAFFNLRTYLGYP